MIPIHMMIMTVIKDIFITMIHTVMNNANKCMFMMVIHMTIVNVMGHLL